MNKLKRVYSASYTYTEIIRNEAGEITGLGSILTLTLPFVSKSGAEMFVSNGREMHKADIDAGKKKFDSDISYAEIDIDQMEDAMVEVKVHASKWKKVLHTHEHTVRVPYSDDETEMRDAAYEEANEFFEYSHDWDYSDDTEFDYEWDTDHEIDDYEILS